MFSIIIPAHNEERVISRGLRALTDGARAGELEVIVICNGCTDHTPEVARGLGPAVRVIETEVASKVHALNLGDAAALSFPRFYVDADVVLSLAALRELAAQLSRGHVLAVAPRFRMDVSGASWAVRAFYDINGRLPSSREGIGGSGVYALSEEGRRRFGVFPDVVADDGFVRVQFREDERRTCEQCTSIVTAPRTLADLIKIKTRSHFGTCELRRLYPQLTGNLGKRNSAALVRLLLKPWLWCRLAAYAFVKIQARRRSRLRQRRAAGSAAWERDETSRTSGSKLSDAEAGHAVAG